MEGNVCEFLMENYRRQVEEALRRTRQEDVEHGMTIVGQVEGEPTVETVEGEEGYIETQDVPVGADIAVAFHTHHIPEDIVAEGKLTADAMIGQSLSDRFSPEDVGTFSTRFLTATGLPTERPDGFVRGSVIATWQGESVGEITSTYKIKGLYVREPFVALPPDEKREVAVGLGIAVDGEAPDSDEVPDEWTVPEWLPDMGTVQGNQLDRIDEVVGEWIGTCEVGPIKLKRGVRYFRSQILSRMGASHGQ